MKEILKENKNCLILLFFTIISLALLSACDGITPTIPVINSFNADDTAIDEGGSVNLIWSVSDASAVTINQSIGSVALSGSTSVSPTTTTIYTLTATNSAGSSSASITITVNPADIIEQTMTLPLGPLNGQDSYVYKGDPDTNFNSSELIIGYGFGFNDLLWSFIRFDLSIVPVNATIVSAELKLFQYESVNMEGLIIGVHKVNGPWSENTLTWNNQPSYNAAPEDIILRDPSENIWISWDIASLMQGWVDGSITNYGVVLKDEFKVIASISCYASEYESDITLRPKLEITYYVP
jgi:hypothetical protein